MNVRAGCTGRVKGRIVRAAARAEGEGQAPSTGKLTFEDDVGNVRTCSYALDQARPRTRAPRRCRGGCSVGLPWRPAGDPRVLLVSRLPWRN